MYFKQFFNFFFKISCISGITQYSEFDPNKTPVAERKKDFLKINEEFFKKGEQPREIKTENLDQEKKITDISIPNALGNFKNDGKFQYLIYN